MKLKDVSQLEYIHFNTSNPGPYRQHCKNSYSLWKKQWTKTFDELKTKTVLYSDDFINREVCGLFLGEEPVGFYLLQIENFNIELTPDLKYFNNYDDELINRHKSYEDKVLITTYLTSDSDWRKSFTNYSISEVLTSLVILRLLFSESSRIIGCYRNSHKVNELFYRHGGEFIKNHTVYNADVDFAEVIKSKAHLSPKKDHAILAAKLWSQFLTKHRGEKYELTRNFKSQYDGSLGGRFSVSRLEQ